MERNKEIRNKKMEKRKIHALIDNVPRVPDITDDYVVNLMQNELAKLKNRGINVILIINASM